MNDLMPHKPTGLVLDTPDPGSRVEVDVEGRIWLLDRAADMEALWDDMDDDDLGDDERLP